MGNIHVCSPLCPFVIVLCFLVTVLYHLVAVMYLFVAVLYHFVAVLCPFVAVLCLFVAALCLFVAVILCILYAGNLCMNSFCVSVVCILVSSCVSPKHWFVFLNGRSFVLCY